MRKKCIAVLHALKDLEVLRGFRSAYVESGRLDHESLRVAINPKGA